jgi:hypothetical protein
VEEGEHMLELPSARPEFRNLSEAEVWETINGDPFQESAITAEVTRLVVQYTVWLKGCLDQRGDVPPSVMHVEVRWPIERVAVLVMAKAEAALVSVH